ncbi:hypothetical protein TNCV_646831 [Trichonephila clavipes]|nr:hypothetical protein TNCV_646831 [Trichonephila clavipes]
MEITEAIVANVIVARIMQNERTETTAREKHFIDGLYLTGHMRSTTRNHLAAPGNSIHGATVCSLHDGLGGFHASSAGTIAFAFARWANMSFRDQNEGRMEHSLWRYDSSTSDFTLWPTLGLPKGNVGDTMFVVPGTGSSVRYRRSNLLSEGCVTPRTFQSIREEILLSDQ